MMDALLTAAVTTVIPGPIASLAPSSQLPRPRLPPCGSVTPESHKAPWDPELPPSSPPLLAGLPVSPETLEADSEPELPPPLPVPRQTSLGSVCPDSLDAACEPEPRPSSLPPPRSQPPRAVRKSKRHPSPSPPQSPPRSIATNASLKASTKTPRTRGLNLSSTQQKIFQTYFERGMTNGSSNTLGWREEVQVSTGLTMQQVNVYRNAVHLPCQRR